MSSSNCYFLTCIQISQEAGQVVWYSHLFQNFPEFVVIHTVKGFGMVNKAEVDIFLELSCFFDDPADVGSLIFGSSTVIQIGSYQTQCFYSMIAYIAPLYLLQSLGNTVLLDRGVCLHAQSLSCV